MECILKHDKASYSQLYNSALQVIKWNGNPSSSDNVMKKLPCAENANELRTIEKYFLK